MCVQIQTLNVDTQEDAKMYMTGFTIFVLVQNLTSHVRFFSLSPFSPSVCFAFEFWCGRRRSSFPSLTFATVVRGYLVMTGTTWVSFRTLPMCLQVKTLSHFPFNVGLVSILTLDNWSVFNNIVPGSEVSISHHWIIMRFHRSVQLMIVRLSLISSNFLIIQCHHSPKLNRIL